MRNQTGAPGAWQDFDPGRGQAYAARWPLLAGLELGAVREPLLVMSFRAGGEESGLRQRPIPASTTERETLRFAQGDMGGWRLGASMALLNTLTPALSLEGRGRGFSLPAWRVDMLYVIVDDAQDDDKA